MCFEKINRKPCMYLHTRDPDIIRKTPCVSGNSCRKSSCLYNHNVVGEYEDINDECCGICYENIYKTNKKFGLLIACSHVFCSTCIRTYRSSNNRNRLQCPICRVNSYNYFISNVFIKSIQKKKKEFKRVLSKKRNTI